MQVSLASKKVTFIGAGNMAEALVGGLVRGGVCLPGHVTATDRDEKRLALFRDEFGVETSSNNCVSVKEADIVVLAIKPQAMKDVLRELKGSVPAQALVLTIAAGIQTVLIEERLGSGMRVVRVMPNTPALVKSGIAAVCAGHAATDEDMRIAETIMGAVGRVVRVEESDMDAVTAVSGSGPAYVFYLIEAMQRAANALGLPAETARELVYGTVEGAARLIIESGVDAGELRRRVTSKGGTTEAALNLMHARGVGEALVEAVEAAAARSRELAGE